MKNYKRRIKENDGEWAILEDFLRSNKVSYKRDSEFDYGYAIVHIDSIGKELVPISLYINVLSDMEKMLRKFYRDYEWSIVNHGNPIRIDIIRK